MSNERQDGSQRGWRRLSQFSMRTMLILTTIVAIAIWWYRRPEPTVTDLAGGGVIRIPTTDVEPTDELPVFSQYHGNAKALDAEGRVLMSGRFRHPVKRPCFPTRSFCIFPPGYLFCPLARESFRI